MKIDGFLELGMHAKRASYLTVLRKPDFLAPQFCRRVRAAMDRGTHEAAAIAGVEIAEQPQVRRALSIDIDAGVLAQLEMQLEQARPLVEAAFSTRLGTREGTGVLRYKPGGFYRRHRDRGEVAGWPAAARRAVAIVVFLNADFTGGALRLYRHDDSYLDITPAEGQLIAFWADDLHEALPVTAGVRDVAVDWFYDE